MSLINDALKRASQGQTPPLPTMEVMQPVNYPCSAKWPLVILPLILISVLSVAIWFVMKGWQTAHQGKPIGTTTVSVRRAAPPASAPVVQSQSGAAVPEPATESSAAPVAAAKEPVVVEPPVPATPTFPHLKLQAVFYRAHNPSVVINTRPLRVGDRIDNARVISITREGVVVEWGGETRSLVLP